MRQASIRSALVICAALVGATPFQALAQTANLGGFFGMRNGSQSCSLQYYGRESSDRLYFGASTSALPAYAGKTLLIFEMSSIQFNLPIRRGNGRIIFKSGSQVIAETDASYFGGDDRVGITLDSTIFRRWLDVGTGYEIVSPAGEYRHLSLNDGRLAANWIRTNCRW